MLKTLLAVILGGALLWGIVHLIEDPPVSRDAEKHMTTIVAGLNKDLAATSPVCVYEGPFPVRVGRPWYPRCRKCEQLLAAGLIEKRVRDGAGDSAPYRYRLTEAGRAVYTVETDALSGRRGPRFCFGTARVGRVVEALPGKVIGGNTIISVKYTIDVLDPHPLLYTPDSGKLGLPTLPAASTTIPGTTLTTVLLSYPTGRYNYQDGTMRYGKWLNEPAVKR